MKLCCKNTRMTEPSKNLKQKNKALLLLLLAFAAILFTTAIIRMPLPKLERNDEQEHAPGA